MKLLPEELNSLQRKAQRIKDLDSLITKLRDRKSDNDLGEKIKNTLGQNLMSDAPAHGVIEQAALYGIVEAILVERNKLAREIEDYIDLPDEPDNPFIEAVKEDE